MALSRAEAAESATTSSARLGNVSATTASARLGNVSAVLFPLASASGDRVEQARDVLTASFVSVREREAGPTLSDWVEALESAGEERVLLALVGARGIEPDTVLALTCWPEADALVHGGADAGSLVMLRREAALASARASVARGEEDPFAWLVSIEAEHVDARALGLAIPPPEAS